ncbi:hypothetical protein EDD85DRAFT_957837 [Armillaria nabsnona]|nr:hypothetical protein EDD85DRAFT_957837 [Armillaria nabsnona]
MATPEYEQVEGRKLCMRITSIPVYSNLHMIPKLLKAACKDSVFPRLVIVASDMEYRTLINIMIPNCLIFSLLNSYNSMSQIRLRSL